MQVTTEEMLIVEDGLRADPGQHYKNRVKAIKETLPVNWRKVLYSHYPAYATGYGANLLRNVMILRSADMRLTVILEQIHSKQLTLKLKAA